MNKAIIVCNLHEIADNYLDEDVPVMSGSTPYDAATSRGDTLIYKSVLGDFDKKVWNRDHLDDMS